MTKKTYFMAILFALVMQSMSVWANTLSISPVSLYRRHAPKLDGTLKPSKAPANLSIPLTVYLDEDTRKLTVTALADGDFTYYIYNDSGDILSQGILNCIVNSDYSIDLWLCNNGEFSIVFMHQENTYEGTFEIEL